MAADIASTPDFDDSCIGVDVGGTFTDVVLTSGGLVRRAKAPTTAEDIGRGVLDACRLVADRAGTTLAALLLPRVRRFGLGTTAVTNALAARNGRRVGLITTRGFEDLVPLARGRRVNDHGWLVLPPQVIERACIAGVAERIDRHGDVLVPLDAADVAAAGRRLVDEQGVEALAVSFLWSFRNAVHEDIAVGALSEALPGVPVTSGAALLPVIREYERSTFAVLNAYTSGALVGVDRLSLDLAALGLRVPVLLVHSGGGATTVAEAHRVPISLAESGPAAGVAAAVEVARARGIVDAVTCDMGGTSFDVSVVSDGRPARRSRGDLMGVWTALSLVDVDSIGAGGGSVGWADARSMLRVGPHSAGASPGPACYGRGGREPTITDALLVLGYLAPDRFLGGDMALDVAAALDACAALGAGLGVSAQEVAWGMRELALVGMAKAVRARSSERGLDPRRHALISYGGCGALFAAEIARAIGSSIVVIPETAAVLSAYGAATTDVRRERAQSVGLSFPVEVGAVAAIADKLRADVDGDVAADGIAAADRSVGFEFDLRFARQKWELTIALPGARVDEHSIGHLLEHFREEYGRRYGEGALMAGAIVELVAIRAIGTGATAKPRPAAIGPVAQPHDRTRDGAQQRSVAMARGGDPTAVAVHDAQALEPGDQVHGPALIDGRDTTIWVPDAATLQLDHERAFMLEVR